MLDRNIRTDNLKNALEEYLDLIDRGYTNVSVTGIIRTHGVNKNSFYTALRGHKARIQKGNFSFTHNEALKSAGASLNKGSASISAEYLKDKIDQYYGTGSPEIKDALKDYLLTKLSNERAPLVTVARNHRMRATTLYTAYSRFINRSDDEMKRIFQY